MAINAKKFSVDFFYTVGKMFCPAVFDIVTGDGGYNGIVES